MTLRRARNKFKFVKSFSGTDPSPRKNQVGKSHFRGDVLLKIEGHSFFKKWREISFSKKGMIQRFFYFQN